jgi:DHA2 family multidrug resistance protein
MMGGLNQYAGFWDIFWPRTLQGFALGFLFVPLTTASLAGISRSAMSNATGIYTLVRQLGGSLGIALLELIQIRREDLAQQVFAAGITLSNPNVAKMIAGVGNRAQALASIGGMVVTDATVVSYDYVFRFCALVFLLSIPTVLFLRKPAPRAAVAEAALVE